MTSLNATRTLSEDRARTLAARTLALAEAETLAPLTGLLTPAGGR